MKIQKDQLVKLFVEGLSVSTATGWDDTKLVAKAQKLKTFKEPDQQIPDPALNTLYQEAVAALDNGEAVEVEGLKAKKPAAAQPPKKGAKKEEPAPAKKKPAAAAKKGGEPAPRPRKAEEDKVPQDWKSLTSKWAKTPQPFTDRGDGVVKFIRDELVKAGEREQGITIKKLHEKMCNKFKERDSSKMLTTLKNQIPSRLRIVRGIHVWKDGEGGYYIPKDGGRKPQPKQAKAAKKDEEPTPAKKPAVAAKKPAAKKKATAGV